MSLEGRVSVVTGGATGLGLQMATALAEAGSNIVLCSRKLENCEQAAAQIEKLGVKALAFGCDVTKADQVESLKDAIMQKFNRVDVLVNNASIAGLVGRNPKAYNSIAYGTSKGALVNFTRDLAVKWAQHNIQVNAICPGFFVTPINARMFERNSEQILREIPLARTGGDDDLKGIAVLLASDASNFMTGAVIPVDGGSTAW